MTERRTHQRSRAFQSGTVASSGQGPSDCVVRDLSEGGAMLEFSGAPRASADIDLDMPRGGGLRRARVVWRARNLVGVAFAPATPPAVAPSCEVVSLEAARRLRAAGSDGDRLAERVARVMRPRPGPAPFWASADAEG